MKKITGLCVAVLCAIMFTGLPAFAGSDTMSQDVTRADKLIGKTAKDQQGNDLGEIKDLVFDQNGQASYIILSSRTSGDLVPVPYSQAQMSLQQDEIILQNIDQAKLQNAPTFTEDEWQKLSQSDFEQEVRGYFGSPAGQTDQDTRGLGTDSYHRAPGQTRGLDDPSAVTPAPGNIPPPVMNGGAGAAPGGM